jgi:tetratricopeptide (TPR) repeat protein
LTLPDDGSKNKAPDELLIEAEQISARGDLEDAAKELSRLVEDYPEYMAVRFSYAAVLFQLRRFADVIPHFARVLEDQPVNERASLGLFHSLWKTENKAEAVKEVRRFRAAGGESMEYRRLARDISKVL